MTRLPSSVSSWIRTIGILLFCGVQKAVGKAEIPPPPPQPQPPRGVVSSTQKEIGPAVAAVEKDKHTNEWTSPSTDEHLADSDNDTDDDDDDDGGDSNDNVIFTTTKPVVQLYETEVWDGVQWRAPGWLQKNNGRRWTMKPEEADGVDGPQEEVCLAPAQQKPKRGYQWEGDWKILTGTSTRDSFGWEYTLPHDGSYPIRQRIWLRTMAAAVPTRASKTKRQANIHQKESDSSLSVPKKKTRRKPTKKSKTCLLTTKAAKALSKQTRTSVSPWMDSRLFRAIADDFNFKGFGFALWKGITNIKSFGLTFKVPLQSCFNTLHSNPCLPNLNLSIGLYYPPMVMVYLASSIRLAWLKWSLYQTWIMMQYMLLQCLWTFYRGLLLALSALAFPVTRKWYNPPPFPVPWTLSPRPVARDVDERVGYSYSWRYTPTKGFFTAHRVWHYYAPTVASLYKSVEALAPALVPEMPQWIARRSAELALDMAIPNPDEPYFSAIAGLVLSGYYFKINAASQTVQLTTAKEAAALQSTMKETNEKEADYGIMIDDDEEEEDEEEEELLTVERIASASNSTQDRTATSTKPTNPKQAVSRSS